jgi:hypothetical protein
MRHFIYNLAMGILAFAMFVVPSLVGTGITSLLPSPDGTCGGKTNYTCANSGIGNCCSSYGFCGSTTAFCLPSHGCQPSFGACSLPPINGTTPSTDGICGGSVTCSGGVFDGYCCSSYGFCGTTEEFCAIEAGCQPKFGKCTQVSPDGTCGGTTDNICTGSTFGICCSEAGWCGSTPEFCGLRCQGQAGLCLAPSVDGTCGWERGYTCLGSQYGECCSSSGWCGNTTEYCSIDKGCFTSGISNPYLGVCTEH